MHFFLGALRVKINFLTSQPKDMLWVLKITDHLNEMVLFSSKLMGKKIFTFLR